MIKSIFLTVSAIAAASGILVSQDSSLPQSIKRGKDIYLANCMSCHMEKGEGLPDVYPPLAKSDYLLKDPKRTIGIVLNGQKGEITVNGKKYDMEMPAQSVLTDEQIADVINYVTNSWGNKTKTAITPAMVKAERK
jgi:mono/diheme cytochrome c family protein